MKRRITIMNKNTMNVIKNVAIVFAGIMLAIFITYSIGMGAGMAHQKKAMEDEIFKACAVTENDTAEMVIGGISYVVTIKH
jgi:hypothetical protein